MEFSETDPDVFKVELFFFFPTTRFQEERQIPVVE